MIATGPETRKVLEAGIAVLLFALSVYSACHAVLHKRDPRAGFAWTALCFLLPGAGPLLYWLFGINLVRTRAKKLVRLAVRSRPEPSRLGSPPFHLPADHPFHARDYRGILNVADNVNHRPLMLGNRLEVLKDGEEAYPRMLQAIAEARKFVQLCTYIFEPDEIGRKFVRALRDAQDRGVKVWVLVDAVGERYSHPPIGRLLRKAGIPFARFLPLSLSNGIHFNLRNHRKSLVVDGRVGFTGGMNISRRHLKQAPVKEPVSDVHFRIEGPVVLELQEVFLEDWHFATRESLEWMAEPHDLLPGETVCRVVTGGPNEDFGKTQWILLGALAWASRRVQIMTPYFVPDRVTLSALNTAALRGVSVEVILPERSNLPFVAWAGRAYLWEMLERGVRFFYQPPPFAHSKLFVVDGKFSLVGSSNWDARSLRLNFEMDVEVYDPVFSKRLSDHFDRIRSVSREVSLEEVNSDPWPIRLRNSAFKLFTPYL